MRKPVLAAARYQGQRLARLTTWLLRAADAPPEPTLAAGTELCSPGAGPTSALGPILAWARGCCGAHAPDDHQLRGANSHGPGLDGMRPSERTRIIRIGLKPQ